MPCKWAKQNSDADETLQSLIQEFNLKRMAINHEATKEDRDEERLQTLNEEMRASYAEIMRNPNMMAYNHAKEGMDAIMKRIQAILTQCAPGSGSRNRRPGRKLLRRFLRGVRRVPLIPGFSK